MKGTARFDIEKGRIDSQLFEVDKRVLGFAGPTSSMHYVMRMEEKFTDEKLVARPSATLPTAVKPAPTAQKKSTVARRQAARRPSSRTANRNNFGKPGYVR
jgi:hypothetical protein